MSTLTSPFLTSVRRLARRTGVTRLLGRVLATRDYEDRFSSALASQLRQGDVIWDVGANLGLYTREFASATGPNGLVVAFEPVAACASRLQTDFADNERVLVWNVALGDSDGNVCMAVDSNPLAATHRVLKNPPDSEGAVIVEVRSAASVVEENPSLFPNFVKIDVEGHEGAVIDGMESLLTDHRLRCIGIEVHFGLLDQRHEGYRPRQIERTLLSNGFRVRWTDPSHILALR